MQRLRVMQIVTRLNVGGISPQVVSLATRLDPERFDTRLVAGSSSRSDGDMLDLRPDLAAELGDRLVRLPEMSRGIGMLSEARAVRSLIRELRAFDPHIVHTHMSKARTLGRLAAARAGTPIVVHTFHGTVFGGHFTPMVSRTIAAWERLLARSTDAIVAVSPTVARELTSRGIGAGRVRTMPIGLDLDAFVQVPPLTAIPPVATAIARLVAVKDIPLLIEAARIARIRLPELVLRIVGDGPMRRELEGSAPPWVEFLGHRADLSEILGSTGVVVLSSRSEGSPVALVEALAAARPVVAVPVGGVVDLLENRPGALLVADRGPQTLAAGIETALTDPTLAAQAAGSRADVASQFGAERLVANTQDLYEELWAPHDHSD